MVRDLVVLLLAITAALAGLGLVRRRVPLDALRKQHEVAGVAYAVLAGLYGVILAFVLVSSWQEFENVRHTIELEADAAGNLRRHSYGFAEAAGTTLRVALATYLRSVVENEWPAMARAQASPEGWDEYAGLWKAVLAIEPRNDKETALWQTTIEQMDALSAARRERVLFSNTTIPDMVWAFLVTFGVVTVSFTYLFGMENLRTHRLIAGALAATICSALILIRETQTPFRGGLTLSPQPFEVLLERLREDDAKALTR
jgi:Protein of unknown function (DUF4239)